MKKTILALCATAAVAFASPALAQETTTYNSTPADGFHYGTGNDYSPANAAVLTSDDTELALRMHADYAVAPASDANGIYYFALGSSINYDWSIDGLGEDALITLTDLGTSQSISYNPLCPFAFACFINDNYVDGTDTDLTQNSQPLGGFYGLSDFDPNVNDTYRVDLASDGHTLTVFAQLGSGASAVPEPATWAMMLLGFGAIGVTMRRRNARIPQLA